MAVVYKHIRPDNGMVYYVGIGKDKSRAYCFRERNSYWLNIYRKYGVIVEITFDNLTFDQAKSAERWLISLYGRHSLRNGHLTNMTDGGDGMLGMKHTEESRKRMSEKRRGPNNVNYGKKFSEERRRQMSEYKKGKKRSLESRIKQSKTLTGRKRPDHSAKMSGPNSPLGKSVTDGVRVWGCIKEAAKELGVSYTTLAGQLNPNDKRKNLLGLKYVQNEH